MKNLTIAGAFLIMLTAPCCNGTRKMTTSRISDTTDAVCVERSPGKETALLHINHPGPWRVYSGLSPLSIDEKHPVATGEGAGIYPLGVAPSSRSYFRLNGDGPVIAEKILPLAGTFNCRDMGGIAMTDGRRIKWGRLLRSDELSNLTPADLTYLSSVPVRTVVDFRSGDEIAQAPDKVPSSVRYLVELRIEPGNLGDMASNIESADQAKVAGMMEYMNRLLVSDPGIIEKYKKFFRLLTEEGQLPLLYHCTAGKDRTGMAGALILYALGADDRTVMEDYMLSAELIAPKFDSIARRNPQFGPALTVRPEFLRAGLETIDRKYGSVDRYLTEILEVDTVRFRNLFLE